MLNVMKADLCPYIKISKDCADPYSCPLEDECWGFLPESSVFHLYNVRKKKAFELFEDGVVALSDAPLEALNDKQGIQHKCEVNNEVHVNKDELKKFLDSLVGPIYYLDFETFMSAVPVLDGTRPYQQIPFQWSLHVDSEHYEFLAPSKEDPRLEFLKTLKEVLGSSGSIVTYNQSFEIRMLREMALVFPSYHDWVESVVLRVVDLIVPFRQFHYYNPKQKGACGLKNVLPAIIGEDPYKKLNIGDGGLALISYFKMTYMDGPDVRDDLLKYCELDTKAMVLIVEKLRELVNGK